MNIIACIIGNRLNNYIFLNKSVKLLKIIVKKNLYVKFPGSSYQGYQEKSAAGAGSLPGLLPGNFLVALVALVLPGPTVI